MIHPRLIEITIVSKPDYSIDLRFNEGGNFFSNTQTVKILSAINDCIVENNVSLENKTFIKKSDVLTWISTLRFNNGVDKQILSEFNKTFQ